MQNAVNGRLVCTDMLVGNSFIRGMKVVSGQGIVFEISHDDHFSVDEVGCQGLHTLKLLLLPILDRLRNLVGE